MIEEFVPLITNVGFPIAMTIYLIMRFEKTLKENTKVMESMISLIKNKI